MKAVSSPLIVMSVFIWIGFVCAISFMEAWIKFQAPGVDLAMGLGIGRLVFSALNKVEITLSLVIIIGLLFKPIKLFSMENTFFFIAFLILILQTFWLLPQLDIRAEAILNGMTLQGSSLHMCFVIMESLKVICLFLFGMKQFKNEIS